MQKALTNYFVSAFFMCLPLPEILPDYRFKWLGSGLVFRLDLNYTACANFQTWIH